jgi:hypothetical protein
MGRRIRRAALAGACALAVVATAAAPANAAMLTVSDRIGDAVPAVDITRLTVVNETGAVTVRGRVPDLRPRRVGESIVALRVREPSQAADDYVVVTRRTATGLSTKLWEAPFASEGPEQPTPCPGLTVRWERQSRVVATVPASCLSTNRTVQAGLYLERRGATEPRQTDWAPGRYASLSPWVPRG